MTRDELLARLNSIEWDDIEYKAASWEVPKSALSTVSAFANTTGGHLVFGVQEGNGQFSVSGVIDADRLQNDFLGQIRDKNKNCFLLESVEGIGRLARYSFIGKSPSKIFFNHGNNVTTFVNGESAQKTSSPLRMFF